jgi:hypothetical protein
LDNCSGTEKSPSGASQARLVDVSDLALRLGDGRRRVLDAVPSLSGWHMKSYNPVRSIAESKLQIRDLKSEI